MSFKGFLFIYFTLVLVPYILALGEGLEFRGWIQHLVVLLNITGMAMFLAQFGLFGRISSISSRAGVDRSLLTHRRVGELLAIFFLLHPFLIVLPRLWIAPQTALSDVWTTFTGPDATTGVFAWSLLIVWALMSKFRDHLGISYEAWHISHGIGFVAVAILATHHVVTVGRHGRYSEWFDALWIALCTIAVAAVLYTYFVKPWRQRNKRFRIVDCSKISRDDWYLTIEKEGDFDFDFDAGQFAWIDTSGNRFSRLEHPFSIASSPSSLPRLSFVIRELGDYTSNLHKLRPGQRVYVDGPHGDFTLTGRRGKGVGLIAGGSGIGPIMGIVRQLEEIGDSRPVRLVYGNGCSDQMVFQQEADELRYVLDFEQTAVLADPPDDFNGYKGVIDGTVLEQVFGREGRRDWDYYVCGPPGMVQSVRKDLKSLGVPADKVSFEQFAF
jgi:predicted ferric reductase